MNTGSEGCKVEARQPVSEHLNEMAKMIAKLAQETEIEVNTKLTSVMNDGIVPAKEVELRPPEQVWPLLFNNLRDSLEAIRTSLMGIHQLIDRVEL